MSIGCSSSCCTAPFQRYTERQGARILIQAARFFCTSSSASRSAAARSGKLVSTKSVLMSEPFLHGTVAKAHTEYLLQPPVIEAPRFAHEARQRRRHPRVHLSARNARRPRQSDMLGDEIEPVAHAHLRIVGRVIDAGRRIRFQRAGGDGGEIVGVN